MQQCIQIKARNLYDLVSQILVGVYILCSEGLHFVLGGNKFVFIDAALRVGLVVELFDAKLAGRL